MMDVTNLKEQIRNEVIQELRNEFAQDIKHIKLILHEVLNFHMKNSEPYFQNEYFDSPFEDLKFKLQKLNETLDKLKRSLR